MIFDWSDIVCHIHGNMSWIVLGSVEGLIFGIGGTAIVFFVRSE